MRIMIDTNILISAILFRSESLSRGTLYNKGEILLNFKKENSNIYTNWGKIEPILPENKELGKVYFTKMKE